MGMLMPPYRTSSGNAKPLFKMVCENWTNRPPSPIGKSPTSSTLNRLTSARSSDTATTAQKNDGDTAGDLSLTADPAAFIFTQERQLLFLSALTQGRHRRHRRM
jgi:hypothetical protein